VTPWARAGFALIYCAASSRGCLLVSYGGRVGLGLAPLGFGLLGLMWLGSFETLGLIRG